ncbi:MAG: putative toxin-antitoxin system toxin component, PIN family [Deltaproteobacteria bacterium]|nr:putative toxin-antitoxin system toxin component, PIN family [Deltaproteobacteria bacterium]MCL5878267.1 putative toxin-antitoxin system toxin component, PIN family [Deltaproteobacteria bacterium]
MYRVVIDTNVLISGIIQRSGFPFNVIKLWENAYVVIITSLATIEEAERVLHYPKIKKNYKLTDEDINHILSNLFKYSVFVENLSTLNIIKEDPADNTILATAISGKADYIISGDAHLLNLDNFRGIDIVTPKRFCEIMGKLKEQKKL